MKSPKTLAVTVFQGDLLGCWQYRIRAPHDAMGSDKINLTCYPFIPNIPGQNQLQTLVDMLYGKCDLVIIQRCYVMSVVKTIRDACDFLGIPLLFETDDDYLNLPYHNPAYLSMIPEEKLKGASPQDIFKLREEAMDEYKKIIGMMDAVIVSTQELKDTLYPYNKHIEVFPNNISQIWERRDHHPEQAFAEDGMISLKKMERFRLWMVPDFTIKDNKPIQTVRIGYAGTVTHRGPDFDTIKYHWERLIQTQKQSWFVFLGDAYFAKHYQDIAASKGGSNRMIHIPSTEYDLYMLNLRNLDISIAPLDCNIFNMSKSEVKALEAAAWAVPSVLPDYITYNRTFTHGENCLLYKSGKEFKESIEELVNNPELRIRLGRNAQELVANTRLEKHHVDRRYNFYRSLIDNSYPLKVFNPKETTDGLQ